MRNKKTTALGAQVRQRRWRVNVAQVNKFHALFTVDCVQLLRKLLQLPQPVGHRCYVRDAWTRVHPREAVPYRRHTDTNRQVHLNVTINTQLLMRKHISLSCYTNSSDRGMRHFFMLKVVLKLNTKVFQTDRLLSGSSTVAVFFFAIWCSILENKSKIKVSSLNPAENLEVMKSITRAIASLRFLAALARSNVLKNALVSLKRNV